jgi:serine/threonine-protein kinase RsbW/stage II sporulation protein AB (anti-sigma F factor)
MVPRPDSPGLGLGLPLIASLTEQLEVGGDAGAATEVRMVFRVAAESKT